MTLLVIKLNKEMTTEECITHSKKIKKELGYDVLFLDSKVESFQVAEIDDLDFVEEHLCFEPKFSSCCKDKKVKEGEKE